MVAQLKTTKFMEENNSKCNDFLSQESFNLQHHHSKTPAMLQLGNHCSRWQSNWFPNPVPVHNDETNPSFAPKQGFRHQTNSLWLAISCNSTVCKVSCLLQIRHMPIVERVEVARCNDDPLGHEKSWSRCTSEQLELGSRMTSILNVLNLCSRGSSDSRWVHIATAEFGPFTSIISWI